MKTKFSLSILAAALLFTTTHLAASSYHDSVADEEAKALKNPQSVDSKSAQKKVMAVMTQENYLAKVKAGTFKKEATVDETKRLHKVINDVVQAHKNGLKKAPKEFLNALNSTVMALGAIRENKINEAQKLLAQAQKDFDTAFKKEPKLGLIPVVDNAEVITFNAPLKVIKHIKDAATQLLEDNDTQVAIDMLTPLQDEIIIKTQYVPAYLYPKAVKEAQKELKDGKKDAAFSTIVTALDASELKTIIIPIPLLTAQDMVLEASKLEKSDKKGALKLLNAAQEELQKAVLLGYTHEYTLAYKNIDIKIEALKKEIEGKNIVAKLYDELLKSFKDLGLKQTSSKKN